TLYLLLMILMLWRKFHV
ncbi:TCP pilus virulence regulatory protein, partial [Vibrio cholerae HC-80A1]